MYIYTPVCMCVYIYIYTRVTVTLSCQGSRLNQCDINVAITWKPPAEQSSMPEEIWT